MLILGSKLINMPVMGISTGSRLANTKAPIIDPANLKIMAYEIDGPLLTERPSYLRIADVRELSPIGLIVDSSDEFFGIDDIISINKLIELNFCLDGISVFDDSGRKLGKVVDYIIESSSFVIQQLRVKQKVLKSLTNTELLIHRSQIVEISNSKIIVKSAKNKIVQLSSPNKPKYVNPFRVSSPQTNSKDV